MVNRFVSLMFIVMLGLLAGQHGCDGVRNFNLIFQKTDQALQEASR